MTGPPKTLSPYVIDFCRGISSSEPFFIEVTPTAADVVNECPSNVQSRIDLAGGEAVYGWKIWEWYGLMIEAEFHTIWCAPDGSLHDVTPNLIRFGRVLFLPDAKQRYGGQQINNIRKPLIQDARLNRFITIADELFRIYNEGKRANQHKFEITRAEAAHVHGLRKEQISLQMAIKNSLPGRNDLCRCGSGKKSKRCCFRV